MKRATAMMVGGGTVLVGAYLLTGAGAGAEARRVYGAAVTALEWLLQSTVKRVSAHEGKYTSLNLNTDDAGLSAGIIQWAQAPGQLGKLLVAMIEADPAKAQECFGLDLHLLLKGLNAPDTAARMAPVAGFPVWNEPWVGRWRRALEHEPFQRVQLRLASEGQHMRWALDVVKVLNLSTERGLVLAYDRCVQQGGAAVSRAKEALAKLATRGDTAAELDILDAFGAACAQYFRSTEATPTRRFSRLVWRQVSGEWHAFSGKVDLYVDITRRVKSIMDDNDLSDLPSASLEAVA